MRELETVLPTRGLQTADALRSISQTGALPSVF
jgi:hypothetical protein